MCVLSPFGSRRSTSVSSDASAKSDQFEEYDEVVVTSPRENNTIGKGATSKVYRGKYRKQDVAIKCLLRLDKRTEMGWTDLTLIFRESILSSSLTHPNIVKFLGASLTYEGFYLIYEYCVYGDLQQILVQNIHKDTIPELREIKQRLLFLKDISSGMEFLHQHGFIHRDLKTANVVVNYDYSLDLPKRRRFVAKICDFGVTRKMEKAKFKGSIDEQDANTNKDSRKHGKLSASSITSPQDKNKYSSQLTLSSRSVSVQNDTEQPDQTSPKDERDLEWLRRKRDRKKQQGTASPPPNSDRKLQPSKYQRKQEQKEEIREIDPAAPADDETEVLITTTHDGEQVRLSNADIQEISRTIHVGTPAFLAPEILLKLVAFTTLSHWDVRMKGKLNPTNQFDHTDPRILSDFKTDVFSFGVCMWSVITCKLPYEGFEARRMINMIFNQQRLGISDATWEEWDDVVDKIELKKLLDSCWAQYPMNRPSFNEISQKIGKFYDDIESSDESNDGGRGNHSANDYESDQTDQLSEDDN
ncbi:hypothetical protein RFI_18977 [Reticulomyxa filosa]|uniref:Protein kinase domain-containing protein n=1 Tax=Reticulomyxa filosa TaxID=46433 RepID=X6MWC0_RETFI|nr:hypothetical protein RFI_18977 [Reticulomyxa filosa]|eukprot:ETO18303.1 hypothetical protein RFI_18977 [Reticulomyxa filosa]